MRSGWSGCFDLSLPASSRRIGRERARLFAVALGLQGRRRGAVLRALMPFGAGHALAVAGAVGAPLAIGAAIPFTILRVPVAGVLVTFSVMRFFGHWHPRWASMRVGMAGLTLWSFLMATAHGAGLMVVPVFLHMSVGSNGTHFHHRLSAGTNTASALLATGLHAVSYLMVTAFIALLVFEKVGVAILRRAWFNLDLIWAVALLMTGVVTLIP